MKKFIMDFVNTKKRVEKVLSVINRENDFPLLNKSDRVHNIEDMDDLKVFLVAAFKNTIAQHGIISSEEALEKETEFLGVSLARSALASIKKGGRGLTAPDSSALYAGEVSPLFPYIRYGKDQGTYTHIFVSSVKEKELNDLDIGEFDGITASEVVSFVEGNTIIFVEDKFALGIEERKGHWLESKDLPNNEVESVKLWVIPHKNNTKLLKMLPGSASADKMRGGSRELLFDQGMYFTLSPNLRSVVANEYGLSLIEEESDNISDVLQGDYRGEFSAPMREILPIIIRTLLYVKSKNVSMPHSRPISSRAAEIERALRSCSSKKRKDLLREMDNLRVSAYLFDLDHAKVDLPVSAKDSGGTTGKGVAMHVRRGHFHKIYHGPRSQELEKRPYNIMYFPRMIVGGKSPTNVRVNKL